MIPVLIVVLAAVAVGLGAPWWVTGLLVPPAVIWAPGAGIAARLDAAGERRLQRALAGAWVGAALAWVGVAAARELGLQPGGFAAFVLGWSGLGAGVGAWLSRGRALPAARGVERWGVLAVVVAVLGVAAWRADDIARPLARYWWHGQATEAGAEGAVLPVVPGTGWAVQERVGWEEAGAWALTPGPGPGTLTTAEGARGLVVVTTTGPLGTTLRVGEVTATVLPSPTEQPDEGPVRRYVTAGTAAVAVPVDLPPGASLTVETDGHRVHLLTGPDAVWALHATGQLRYVHYYQLLNQVENLDWASEVREDRWFTWNQPPGWSPLLATATLLILDDLQGGNVLFLWVILLVGCSAVRLATVVAPGAPGAAWLVPAGMAGAHGLLMLEPASANFPDSLYAAAVVSVATAAATGRARAFAGLGVWAQALRWPGTVVSLLLAGGFAVFKRWRPVSGLTLLSAGVGLGVAAAAVAALTGHAEDLLFILWFETFPEHWHGEYDPMQLLARVPAFYGTWMAYTGGGLAVAVLGAVGPANPARQSLRALLLPALAYSALLCTIDHHPTHYFLPLVALTGPMVAAASAATRHRVVRTALPIVVLVGISILLWKGQV